MTITLRLTLTVKYDENGETVKALKQQLEYLAFKASGEGMLSGYTDAEVDEWKAVVEVVR